MDEEKIKIAYLKREIQKHPEFILKNSMLKIKNKLSQKVKFSLNSIQKKLHQFIMKNYLKTPLRIIILKARKEGVSTYIGGLFYSFTSQSENTDTVVVAHETEASSYIFNIYKFMHDSFVESYSPLAPELQKNNAKQLEFAEKNSNIFVKTASGEGVGRSFTPRLVHCSEVAFYKQAEQVFTGLNNSVPKANNTIVALESTANGIGNYFHRLWEQAKDIEDWDGTGYVRVFFAWFDSEENQIPLQPGEVLNIPALHAADIYEMWKSYPDLTEPQINWYVRTLREDCNNDIDIMRQEHPSYPKEAFLASGSPVFNQKLLINIYEFEKKLKEAFTWKRYNIIDQYGSVSLVLGEENGRLGTYDIYKHPQTSLKYLMTCDVAEGVEGGDFSIANVWNIDNGEQVAHYRFDGEPFLFTKGCLQLAKIYNNCTIAVERNNHGHSVISELKNHYKYPHIYIFKDKKEGFLSTQESRPKAISYAQKYFSEGYLKIHCLDTINEMMSFVTYKGKPQASKGSHDDEVATIWIFAYIIREDLILNDNASQVHEKEYNNQAIPYRALQPQQSNRGNKITGY